MQHIDPQPWQVLARRYVLDRQPYMLLREDTVLLPNGARIEDYFVFEYPDWVNALALTTDNRFVLVRQYRHGNEGVHFELPGGVADPGESHLIGAQRELLEETGYGGGEWSHWIELSPNPATHTNTCHIFLARGVEKMENQQLDDTEDIAVQLMTPAQALDMLRAGGVAQALHSAALWRFFAEFGLPQAV